MKAFITKYALTQGILEKEGELTDGGHFYVRGELGLYFAGQYFIRKCHAEERRVKKLKSLDKQIKKISAIVF